MKRNHIKKRRKTYALLLALPPLIALVLIVALTATSKTIVLAPEGIMLSPVKDPSPLILSLTIFIIGYMLFIGLLFRDSIEKIFLKKIFHKK